MSTSAELRAKYETSASLLPELIKLGDEMSMKKQLDQANDYNKPILDAQAKNLEANRQIINQYATSLDNPETRQLDVARQMRTREYDTSANREQAGALGSYYNARQGTVADTLNAWKSAYQTRFDSAKAASDQLKEQWQMAFQQEQEDARRQEAAAALAQKYAEMNAGSDSGLTAGDELSALGQRMLTTGATREQAGAQYAADYGLDYDKVMKQVYAKYPDGWESGFVSRNAGAFANSPINSRYRDVVASQRTSAAPAAYNPTTFEKVSQWLTKPLW